MKEREPEKITTFALADVRNRLSAIFRHQPESDSNVVQRKSICRHKWPPDFGNHANYQHEYFLPFAKLAPFTLAVT
jgi:hypothetical protein